MPSARKLRPLLTGKRSKPRSEIRPPLVTALRTAPRGRVEVELDGVPWRKLPIEVVLSEGLATGVEFSRERARSLRRKLRDHEAMASATRALGRRDLSEQELTARLSRARVSPAPRAAVVRRLAETGAVDDARVALRRAEILAERGAGDALIRHDLSRKGIENELIEAAIVALEPELDRAQRIVETRGTSLSTARYLGRKGFSQDSIEGVCAGLVAEDGSGPVR